MQCVPGRAVELADPLLPRAQRNGTGQNPSEKIRPTTLPDMNSCLAAVEIAAEMHGCLPPLRDGRPSWLISTYLVVLALVQPTTYFDALVSYLDYVGLTTI